MTRERRDILARAGLPADRQGAVLAKYVWWGSRTCGSLFSNCFAISSSDGKPPAVTSDARVNVQYDSLLLVGIVTVGHGLSTTLRSFCLPLVPAPLSRFTYLPLDLVTPAPEVIARGGRAGGSGVMIDSI